MIRTGRHGSPCLNIEMVKRDISLHLWDFSVGDEIVQVRVQR